MNYIESKRKKLLSIYDEALFICQRYNVDINFKIFEDDLLPKFSWINNTPYELTININKIAINELSMNVWYFIQQIILSNLITETNRLVIRRIAENDKKEVFNLLSQAEVCLSDGGYEPFKDADASFDDKMNELINDCHRYCIALKGENKLIGIIRLIEKDDRAIPYYEIGYLINQNYWGQGFGYEAVSHFIEYCFKELHIIMIVANCFEWNKRSLNLISKLEFKEEGKRRFAIWHEKFGPSDLIIFYKENYFETKTINN